MDLHISFLLQSDPYEIKTLSNHLPNSQNIISLRSTHFPNEHSAWKSGISKNIEGRMQIMMMLFILLVVNLETHKIALRIRQICGL